MLKNNTMKKVDAKAIGFSYHCEQEDQAGLNHYIIATALEAALRVPRDLSTRSKEVPIISKEQDLKIAFLGNPPEIDVPEVKGIACAQVKFPRTFPYEIEGAALDFEFKFKFTLLGNSTKFPYSQIDKTFEELNVFTFRKNREGQMIEEEPLTFESSEELLSSTLSTNTSNNSELSRENIALKEQVKKLKKENQTLKTTVLKWKSKFEKEIGALKNDFQLKAQNLQALLEKIS